VTRTPDDLEILPRDVHYGQAEKFDRWWLGGDPVATAFYNSLSVTFPQGERFFIDAVRRYKDRAPKALQAQIKAFTTQESIHSREHIAFNRAAEAAGYNVDEIDRRVEALIEESNQQRPAARLAITMALEHFTAMFAHDFLRSPDHFLDSDIEQADLWRWHAVEEIEHKGVADDTWLHATRDWPRFRRWWVRSLVMLSVTWRFVLHRTRDTLDLLEQDGIARSEGRRRLLWYLYGKPGILRRIFPAWFGYFLPGFHPWKVDDRDLIRIYDSEFADAAMPREILPAE